MKCDELKAIESATAVIENVYLVYRKSEADKVISELEARIEEGDKEFDFADHQNERLLKELRHQKYKRCLDKGAYWVSVSYQCIDDKHRQQAERHHRKWLELAAKFKKEA